MPFLSHVHSNGFSGNPERRFPMNLPLMHGGLDLTLTSQVTFFVGENGSGKSTLLEAIAYKCGFNPQGGGINNLWDHDRREPVEPPLAPYLSLGWSPRRIREGFFMRAESYFNFATYIDMMAKDDQSILKVYGGRSLHEQSHGESFLALFNNRFEHGIYILDEPEAALSPQRQLAFMSILYQLEKSGHAQFLIATHSPMLLCYPGATIYSLDDGIEKVDYQQTDHFQLTTSFLQDPERYFAYLFKE